MWFEGCFVLVYEIEVVCEVYEGWMFFYVYCVDDEYVLYCVWLCVVECVVC